MEGNDSPRYTVQQIMLLQKLKQSGLTRDQILKGLDEIEKTEEIPSGPLCPTIKSSGSPPPLQTRLAITNGIGSTHQRDEPTSKDHQRQSSSPTSPQPSASPPSSIAITRSPKILNTVHIPHANPLMYSSPLQNHNPMSLLHSSGAWTPMPRTSFLQNGFHAPGIHTHPMYPSIVNGRVAPSGMTNIFGLSNGNAVVEIDGEKIDITEELDELFRRDQAQVKEDIRKFINERHISQSAIAKATGNAISQSYISQWLAQPQDISGQKKKAMYTWYLIEKRKPPGVVGLNSGAPIIFRNNDAEQEYAPPICLKTKRGARFTWPKECLTILENYYNSNPYPDESKREEIASSCNTIIQTHKAGMMMTDLDKVTTVKVYNWFANRRKDDKRRKHIEHIESLDHHMLTSPTHRSNTVSPSSSNHSNDSMHPQEIDQHSLSERLHPDILARRKNEEQMALALQMAAVNHSILALVNQHRDIMHEERGARTSPGGDSEREENDDDSVEAGSHHDNESRGQNHHHRYRSEGESNEDHPSANGTPMEIHRESNGATMTRSPIQART